MDVPELWTALLSGQYDLVSEMIHRGANVNEPTKTQADPMTTLLHYTVMKSDAQSIRVLAKLGANFNVRDSANSTPLHWTAQFAATDVVEVLINGGAVVDARDHNQMTPLHHHATRKDNYIESAQMLISRGASVDAIGAIGLSVLHLAVICHNLEMVKVLIGHRVDIDAKDVFGCTPLLRSFTVGTPKTEIIKLLLDNGANINSKSRYNESSVFFATKFNWLTSLHLLLKRDARVNEATHTGETALHVACKNKLADATALLLKFGADLNACNQMGKTPFELLPSSPSSEATARNIIREAVKRQALGQSLCEGYVQMAQSCENYVQFDRECHEEIKQLQNEKIDIDDSAISFYYIFSVDEEKLAALARNETIVVAFESSGYEALFRIYAGELTAKFEVAKKRAILPTSVVRKIVEYVKYGYITKNKL